MANNSSTNVSVGSDSSGLDLGDFYTAGLGINTCRVDASVGNRNLDHNIGIPFQSNLTYTTAGSEQNFNMNNPNINDVLNNLKIPDVIKDLPPFSGNYRSLLEFVNNVEEILNVLVVVYNTPYARFMMRAIRNKIVGEANEVLNMFQTPLDWEHIKAHLMLFYSDKRSESNLIRDLHAVTQQNETPERFYMKVIDTLTSLHNLVRMYEKDNNVLIAKVDLYAEMALNTFLFGLKEPLGSAIRAMKPRSIQEALGCCVREQTAHEMRYVDSNIHPKPFRFYNFPQSCYSPSLNNQNFNYCPQRQSVYQRETVSGQPVQQPIYTNTNNSVNYQNPYVFYPQPHEYKPPGRFANPFAQFQSQGQSTYVPRPMNYARSHSTHTDGAGDGSQNHAEHPIHNPATATTTTASNAANYMGFNPDPYYHQQ